MTDIVLETVRAAVLLGLLGFLLSLGRSRFETNRYGWNLIIGGFGLLLFGSVLDITDNFETLNRFVIIGDTEAEAFLEIFVGFLGGFVLLATGLVRWLPSVQALSAEVAQRKQAEDDLRLAHDGLEARVEERSGELQRVSDLLGAILDHSPAQIYLKDTEGRHILASRETERLYAGTDGTVAGKTAHDLFPEESADQHLAHDREVLESRQAATREYEIPGEGGTHTFLSIKFPIFDETGEVTKIGAITTDITERKRAEDAVRESEAQVRLLLDSTAEAIYGIDLDGNCTFCNRACIEMLGYDGEEELLGRHMHELIHHTRPDGSPYPAEECRIYQAFREGKGTHIDDEVLWRKDGSSFAAEYRSYPIRHDRQITGSVVTFLDITDRKGTEEALRRSEERYRELFDESPVAIWVEDWSPIKQMLDDLARGGVKDWRGYFNSHRDQLKTAYDLAENIEISRAVIELYRKESKEHMLQMTASAAVIDKELDAFREMVLSFLAGQMTVDIEAKDMTGDGTEIFVRRRVVIPPKYRDDWSRVIYAIEDITERARVEEQLRQAQKMEAVGQLTGGVAHDFNNLLSVILGNAEFLSDEIGEDERHVRQIMQAASRGADLTGRLLAFSRQQPLKPQTLEVKALVEGMSDMLRRVLGEAIEIKTVMPEGLWPIKADPGQLENALLNLTLNARDAMLDGGSLVIEAENAVFDESYLDAHLGATPGDYVVLAVSDTGTGMAPDVLEHVFEPFFTTKDVGEGSGLGLSMVYGFAKQSDGHVTIYSEQGHGTMVKLYLPRAQTEAARKEKTSEAIVPVGRGETILVVEDDPQLREMIISMLKNLGYGIREAGNAQAALVLLDNTANIDLLLSDVVLPGGMTGFDLAQEAKARHGDLKVLFMSGYAENAVRRNGSLYSRSLKRTHKVLSKPFRQRELAERVRAILDD